MSLILIPLTLCPWEAELVSFSLILNNSILSSSQLIIVRIPTGIMCGKAIRGKQKQPKLLLFFIVFIHFTNI